MAKVSFEYNDRQLRAGIGSFNRNLDRAVGAVVDYNAAYAMGWLRLNAPWTDNTGAARSGLMAFPNHTSRAHEIFMAYSVTYGIWLEIANNGRYAVIEPAMRIVGAKLMRDLQGLIDEMGTLK